MAASPRLEFEVSPTYPILYLALQAGLIVHVIKTGRNMLWIFAIGLVPVAGPLAYIVVELVPALLGGSAGRRRAAKLVQRVMDPDRDLRTASAEVKISGNVDARRRLAGELIERGQYDEAVETLSGGLKGVFQHDPTLLLGLAQANFGKQDYAAARTALEDLHQHNPEDRSHDANLLYARTLEELGELEAAEREYEAATIGYPGAEARLRLALLKKRCGKIEEGRALLKDLLDGAALGPAHYRKSQTQWIDRARRELG